MMLAESAVVAQMHPVVRYVVVEVGLPWLFEPERYSDLWRQAFHDWVDAQAAKRARLRCHRDRG